ncbi:hypothetical protein Tco_1179023 [Tanacetum coccineum]
MAIPNVMLSDRIKASNDYLNYLSKLYGTKPVKSRRKGLLTKQGVEVAVERVSIPKKRRLKTVIEETGQSKEVVDMVDSEETEEDDETPFLRRRQTGEGSGVTPKVLDRLSHKGPNKGSGVTPAVPDEPRDSSSCSSSESDDEIEDISSDEERSKADDIVKVDAEKAEAEKAEEEKAEEEQHVDDEGGNE